MTVPEQPRLAKSYPANVVLVVLTLFPGLINTSAIPLLAPVIGHDLGRPPNAAAAIPLISDAALAFGCVLAAELTRRVNGRTLYFWLLGISLLSSLASALAPSFGVLLAAHIIHGLVAGMLFIVVLPPLVIGFGERRLPTSAMVLVPSLFGAATLGPLLGGVVSSPVVWRAIFGTEVLLALIALLLATVTLDSRDPQGAEEPVDWFALITAGLGTALIYAGVAQLAGHSLADLVGTLPFVAGIVAYLVLIVGEARITHPLVPVRAMFTSLALVGTIATVVASAAFAALTESFTLTLQRIDGLDARATGIAFAPEILTAAASGYIFGRLVPTKWLVLAGPVGLALIALAAGLARVVAPVDAGSVAWLCVIGGMGAGLSVTPGIFVVALASERRVVARAVALLNLLRLTGGFISAPGVEHTIGSRAVEHVRALQPARSGAEIEATVRAFIVGLPVPNSVPVELLKGALIAAVDEAYAIVLTLTLAGILTIAAVLLTKHRRLQRPNLRRFFEEGRPALESTPLT